MDTDLSRVTRLEVIDHVTGDGRVLVRYLSPDAELEASLQDDGRTLKIFLSPKLPTKADAP